MVEELPPAALAELLAAGAEVQVVDVRRPQGYKSGHIPESENVPFEQLLTDIGSVAWGHRVVFVCPYGVRSRQAGELLGAFEGLPTDAEVYNLAGGLEAWNGPLTVTATE